MLSRSISRGLGLGLGLGVGGVARTNPLFSPVPAIIGASSPQLLLVAPISSSGKDRTKYAYFYNKHKQMPAHKKNKKTQAEKEALKAKHAFKVDTTLPLEELLKYSDKKHSPRNKERWSRRKKIKERITQFGQEASPDAAPRATEMDKDGLPVDVDTGGKPLNQWLDEFDTSLSSEQKEKVSKLKHLIRGAGPNGTFIHSPYREVPLPDQIEGTQNIMPYVPDNAEDLIDWALSHVPDRAGPRKKRHMKRMSHRWAQKVKDHAVKKIHNREARMRKEEKLRRSHELNRRIMAMAERVRAGEVPSSGDHILALNPCNHPSMYPETKGKQRAHKKKLLMRDFRLPNPTGIKGLRMTQEAMGLTTAAIREEQRADHSRAEKMMARVRAGKQNFKATTYHMHKRRQSGKHG